MKIICLLLCFLSLTTARVYPRTGANDGKIFLKLKLLRFKVLKPSESTENFKKVFDGVEGVVYDVPEYEDPEVSLFKLIAKGIMPVYTTADAVKESKDSSNKDDMPPNQTDDIKRGLDTVIAQLQEAKNKLENGNNGIYLDIDKSVLYLENLKHRLYLDLHPVDASEKQSKMSVMSSNKASTYIYPVLRAALKKYLSSDDSTYKYFSLAIPTLKPSSFDDSADSFFDSAFMPYPVPNSSVEQSSADDHSTEQSFESKSSNDQKLPSETGQLLTFVATTEQPVVLGKVFKYQLLRTEMPPVEVTSDQKKVKTDMADDDVPSAEADKDEQPDKAIIRKKWTLKLSSAIKK